MICPTGTAEYFSREDWTGKITLILQDIFVFTRNRQIMILDVGIAERGTQHHHTEFCEVRRHGTATRHADV